MIFRKTQNFVWQFLFMLILHAHRQDKIVALKLSATTFLPFFYFFELMQKAVRLYPYPESGIYRKFSLSSIIRTSKIPFGDEPLVCKDIFVHRKYLITFTGGIIIVNIERYKYFLLFEINCWKKRK